MSKGRLEKDCIVGRFRICTFRPIKYRVIKIRIRRLVGYVTYIGERKNAYKFWWDYLKGGDHLEKLG